MLSFVGLCLLLGVFGIACAAVATWLLLTFVFRIFGRAPQAAGGPPG